MMEVLVRILDIILLLLKIGAATVAVLIVYGILFEYIKRNK